VLQHEPVIRLRGTRRDLRRDIVAGRAPTVDDPVGRYEFVPFDVVSLQDKQSKRAICAMEHPGVRRAGAAGTYVGAASRVRVGVLYRRRLKAGEIVPEPRRNQKSRYGN